MQDSKAHDLEIGKKNKKVIWIFISWIPTLHKLVNSQTNKINAYYNKFYKVYNPPKNTYKFAEKFQGDKTTLCISEPEEMCISIFNNGLFIIEKHFEDTDLDILENFDKNAFKLYETTKSLIHFHLFEHTLGRTFRISKALDRLPKTAAEILEILEKRYLDELGIQKSYIDEQRGKFLEAVLKEVRKFLNAKNLIATKTQPRPKKEKIWSIAVIIFASIGYFFIWSFYNVPKFIEFRYRLCWVLEKVFNASGVQTFVNSFRKLVCGSQQAMQDSEEFITAHIIFRDSVREYGDVIGAYTLQTFAFAVAFLALFSPFIAVGFPALLANLCILQKVMILGVLIIIYNTAGYLVARRVAKRYELLTLLFLDPQKGKEVAKRDSIYELIDD